MPSESIGPYQISENLGQGAFGAVYAAQHAESGRRVALKLLHATKALEPEVQNRFVREIAILQRLDHENIVQHYDCGLHEGNIYCTMELVDCGTLDDALQARASLPWREASEVALQVSRGLAHAHENGCVHRDMKPANLYLNAAGMVKIGDLGLARDLDASRLTTEGETVGTWRYMAPEQITGADDIDGRLDIYALACVLFRMVAGRAPFEGATFAAIFDQHLESPPPRLDEAVPGVPTALGDLVEWMLQKAPKDRPETAAIVAERLEQILSDQPTLEPSRAQEADGETADATPTPPNLTERLLTTAKTTRGEPIRAALAIVVAVAAMATIAFLAFRGGG